MHTNFVHTPLPKIQLVRHDLPTGRVYVTPEGNKYPSVTRVLGFKPKPFIEEWKARVGEGEAKAVSARAAARGTAIHAYTEDYLNNKPVSVTMFDHTMWKSFKRVLSDINNIRLLEGTLYSDKLELAGTTDIVADYKNVLSVIDVKTSLREKCEADIFDYFLQATAYACMVYERYGLAIKQIVILIAVDDSAPLVFVKNVGPYLEPLFDVIRQFKVAQKN